jgi:hypothetical protein
MDVMAALLFLTCAPLAFGSEVAVGEPEAERSLLLMFVPMFRIVAITLSPLLLVTCWGAAVVTLAWLRRSWQQESLATVIDIGIRRVGLSLFVLGIVAMGYANFRPPASGSLLGFLLGVVPIVFLVSTWVGVAVGKVAQRLGARA